MIIWKGLGILVGIAGFVGFMLSEMLTRWLQKDEGAYYSAHAWPKLLGGVLGALLAFGMVKILAKGDKPRVVIDKATGKELQLRRGDALFFVPVKFWPYIILGLGIVIACIPA